LLITVTEYQRDLKKNSSVLTSFTGV